MDGGRLHRLGRRLIELSRQATGPAGDLTAGELAVVEDVVRHPDSAVGEIARRTGFVQSHVSASVARLAERGVLTSRPDPADGRRSLLKITDRAMAAIARRARRQVDEAVLAAFPNPADARRVLALLDELGDLLL
ncbi:winged helix DNA-binding protein [Lentzea tibetensis]|uniref:Winged helix DNA-binding protein n=1 Tax=Lentzea tibetensis TaxID=2591470 RepID=A0A563EX16_9PSEU|nr:helix-turn-helix domain-containing protein [Lentzea tibetensis]TWP52021.1 winged helix DNA-binding protein [Lentzea tibetensis]